MPGDALRVDELERGDGKELLAREAGRNRFGHFGGSLRIGVGRKKRAEGRRLARTELCHGGQQFEKLLGRANRKAVGRLTDDVRVDVLCKMKSNRHSAWS